MAVTIARQLGFSIERMRAEEAKELLLNESKHRIKNTLAAVQAIAGQTLRHTAPDEQRAFLARLHALGEAHDLLTTENWDQAPLRDDGRPVTEAIWPRQDRIVIDGPSMALPAQSSLMLTLCLHELATNAAKYGALSNGTGKVHIGWELLGNGSDRKVRLTWRETGGPPVAPPNARGSARCSSSKASRAPAKRCFEYRPDGLQCSLEIPLY